MVSCHFVTSAFMAVLRYFRAYLCAVSRRETGFRKDLTNACYGPVSALAVTRGISRLVSWSKMIMTTPAMTGLLSRGEPAGGARCSAPTLASQPSCT